MTRLDIVLVLIIPSVIVAMGAAIIVYTAWASLSGL